MTNLPSFPDDENGDVLRRMQAGGDDLSTPRDIDFTVVLPDAAAVDGFVRHFRAQSCAVAANRSGCVAALPWDVRVARRMRPTHAGITAFELELDAIAAPLGGRNDGWGCFERWRRRPPRSGRHVQAAAMLNVSRPASLAS